jgi:hypothetical protein
MLSGRFFLIDILIAHNLCFPTINVNKTKDTGYDLGFLNGSGAVIDLCEREHSFWSKERTQLVKGNILYFRKIFFPFAQFALFLPPTQL